jgi:hypothetical protein
MAKVFIEESSLTALGNAVREKTGGTDLLSPAEMVTAIGGITTGGGGADLPEAAYTITGDCSSKFASNSWNWYIEALGDRVTTKDMTNAADMFYNNTLLTEVPFEMNFADTVQYWASNRIFSNCTGIKYIAPINNWKPQTFNQMFMGCKRLRYLPVFNNLSFDGLRYSSQGQLPSLFTYCSSLRSIPEEFLKELYNPKINYATYLQFYRTFLQCYALDEIRGFNPQSLALTTNAFNDTFTFCTRAKEVIFAVQEDGTPYTVQWSGQTIDLSKNVGIADTYEVNLFDFNSGITKDKKVTDDASYQALKNDPDWYACPKEYSRYNHDSAVNTINSLPDTSAYLASKGGTNTIKFTGAAGSKTDGGAINTLTEEEIAVATAKGWTVTFV